MNLNPRSQPLLHREQQPCIWKSFLKTTPPSPTKQKMAVSSTWNPAGNSGECFPRVARPNIVCSLWRWLVALANSGPEVSGSLPIAGSVPSTSEHFELPDAWSVYSAFPTRAIR